VKASTSPECWPAFAGAVRAAEACAFPLGRQALATNCRLSGSLVRFEEHPMERIAVFFGSVFVCLLPCALILDARNIFYVDWINHLWSIEYFGEYLKANHSFPSTFNTDPVIGIPVPIFYAYHFYAIAGAVAALFGSSWAIRAVVVSLFLVQFAVIYSSLVSRAGRDVAFTVATIVAWSVYPLTNLYNRSAITEFVAITLLTCCVASLLALFFELRYERPTWSKVFAPGLFYVLAAVTHPLTAIFGALLILLIGAIPVAATRSRWLVMFAIGNAAAIGTILSPWLYANAMFGGAMQVSEAQLNRHAFQVMGFFPDTIDSIWSRLSPVPLDGRSLIHGIVDVSTPYLDAQIMFPLCLLLVAMVAIALLRPKQNLDFLILSIISTSITLLIFVTALSVDPKISYYFGEMFNILQFAYRLTSYINLAIIAAVIALASVCVGIQPKTRWSILSLCVGVAFAGLIGKLQHGYAIRQFSSAESVIRIAAELKIPEPLRPRPTWFPGAADEGPRAINLPPTYYGYPLYSVFSGFAKDEPSAASSIEHVTLKVLPAPFGKVQALQLKIDKETVVVTNVQPFPWNKLVVDGHIQSATSTIVRPQQAIKVFARIDGLSVTLPPGDHVLDYRFSPTAVWKFMMLLSCIGLLAWAIILAVCFLADFRIASRARLHLPLAGLIHRGRVDLS
jgi:hypothetical protein